MINLNDSDSWPIVSLAFFLRYPNPYASHVLSCDVISRTVTPSGTLSTTRLILKRGALPKWAPKGIVSRAESWVIEQSEVDPFGKVVSCQTKNLDHVKVMQVHETVELREVEDGYVLLAIADFSLLTSVIIQLSPVKRFKLPKRGSSRVSDGV